MSGDPSDNGVPPERATIDRALRVAQYQLTQNGPRYDPGNLYWHGAVETLRWSLGERETAPVSQRPEDVDLAESRRSTVSREAQYAYECMTGDRRPPVELKMDYLTGAENTLCWVAGGRGFASPLSTTYVHEVYGID